MGENHGNDQKTNQMIVKLLPKASKNVQASHEKEKILTNGETSGGRDSTS